MLGDDARMGSAHVEAGDEPKCLEVLKSGPIFERVAVKRHIRSPSALARAAGFFVRGHGPYAALLFEDASRSAMRAVCQSAISVSSQPTD